jgi:ApbE superfamily uncharacterized protein (UPF0280 family)
MSLGAADAAAVFADLAALGEAVTVTHGGQSATGVLRADQQLLAADDQIERVVTITLLAGAFTGLAIGDTITVRWP